MQTNCSLSLSLSFSPFSLCDVHLAATAVPCWGTGWPSRSREKAEELGRQLAMRISGVSFGHGRHGHVGGRRCDFGCGHVAIVRFTMDLTSSFGMSLSKICNRRVWFVLIGLCLDRSRSLWTMNPPCPITLIKDHGASFGRSFTAFSRPKHRTSRRRSTVPRNQRTGALLERKWKETHKTHWEQIWRRPLSPAGRPPHLGFFGRYGDARKLTGWSRRVLFACLSPKGP